MSKTKLIRRLDDSVFTENWEGEVSSVVPISKGSFRRSLGALEPRDDCVRDDFVEYLVYETRADLRENPLLLHALKEQGVRSRRVDVMRLRKHQDRWELSLKGKQQNGRKKGTRKASLRREAAVVFDRDNREMLFGKRIGKKKKTLMEQVFDGRVYGLSKRHRIHLLNQDLGAEVAEILGVGSDQSPLIHVDFMNGEECKVKTDVEAPDAVLEMGREELERYLDVLWMRSMEVGAAVERCLGVKDLILMARSKSEGAMHRVRRIHERGDGAETGLLLPSRAL